MQFPKSVIEDLARTLRGRDYVSQYPAITAYSEALIAQNVAGTSVLREEHFDALLDSNIEMYMPLPYNNQRLCRSKKKMQFENLPELTIVDDCGWDLLFPGIAFGPIPNWAVVVECDDGKHYIVAHADTQFFEPGELIREVPAPAAPVRISHCYINGTFVTWQLRNWQAVSVIFGDSTPNNIEFQRCFESHSEEADDAGETADDNMILETVHDAETTFIADEIFEAMGVKASQPSSSVAALIQRLKDVEAETVKVDVDEEALEIHGKILKTLNFDAIAADFRALPKSKRTVANLKKIIRQYVA